MRITPNTKRLGATFNMELLQLLGEVEKETAQAILNTGMKFGGVGWTTGRASRVLHELSGVALVSAQWADYLACWLFALSLHWNLELQALDLSDKVAEAGFALVGQLSQEQEEFRPDEDGSQGGSDSDEVVFPWDEEVLTAPKELQELWRRASAGRKLELKEVLSQVPRFSLFPPRAPANNIREHGKRHQDRALRSLQQQVLHLARLMAYTWDGVNTSKKVYFCKLLPCSRKCISSLRH